MLHKLCTCHENSILLFLTIRECIDDGVRVWVEPRRGANLLGHYQIEGAVKWCMKLGKFCVDLDIVHLAINLRAIVHGIPILNAARNYKHVVIK